MAYIHKGTQGCIGTIKAKNGKEPEIHVYLNSQDFFPNQQIQMIGYGEGAQRVERVPINEDIWQKIGEACGYKFKHPKQ